MKKSRMIVVLLAFALLPLVSLASCRAGSEWEGIRGNYVWDESAQFTNATLELMWLEHNRVLFEFDLMEGSEAEDSAINLTVPGVLTVGEDGIGLYEAVAEDGTTAFSIRLTLSDDGQKVTVSHEGELPISPDGSYSFIDSTMEVSDVLARELVSFLPTADTGLDTDSGAYTLQYPEGLVGDWFYPLEATANDGGAVLAKFIVARDLSAVFRVDDNAEPKLIYGSAQPMMEAEFWSEADDLAEALGGIEALPSTAEEALEPDEEMLDEPSPVVLVGIDGGTLLAIGESAELEAYLPWTLPYTVEAQSADPSIVSLNGQSLTAISAGDTEITGKITIADGTKDFCITVSVMEEAEGQGDLIDDAFAGEPAPVG